MGTSSSNPASLITPKTGSATALPFSGQNVAYIQSLLLPIPASAVVPGTFAPGNYTFPGNLAVTGNETVGGTLAVTGNETVGGTLAVTGNETVGGTLAVTGNETISGGTLLLNNGTSNFVSFNTSGLGPPTFTTSSLGTKVLLYPAGSSIAVDYAIGVQGGTVWLSVPNSTGQFLWYAATTAVASLSGTGVLAAKAVESSATGSTQAYTPPVYTIAGVALAATTHMVSGSVTLTSAGAASQTSAAVNLTGSAVFASASSYVVAVSFGSVPSGWFGVAAQAARASGSAFSVSIYSTTGSNSIGAISVSVDFIAVGA